MCFCILSSIGAYCVVMKLESTSMKICRLPSRLDVPGKLRNIAEMEQLDCVFVCERVCHMTVMFQTRVYQKAKPAVHVDYSAEAVCLVLVCKRRVHAQQTFPATLLFG